MNTVYFQTEEINPLFCEVGMIPENDPNYIWYLNEPCKILINEVKIIPEEDVIIQNKKYNLYRIKNK